MAEGTSSGTRGGAAPSANTGGLFSSANRIFTVIANSVRSSKETVSISISDLKPIAAGTYGRVSMAKLSNTQETVAIKRVLQDKKFKNRELEIMTSLDHCNVIQLKYYFFEQAGDETYLNLILEYIPQTLSTVIRHYHRNKQLLPIIYIRVYAYQLMRGLMYLHSWNICHRDLKPQNILVHTDTGQLKVCDFGSAKRLKPGEVNVSYIASRYYRAPELIMGSVNYTTKIDIWSAGCIIAEIIQGKPPFVGSNGLEVLYRMVKVLGTPTTEQLRKMGVKSVPDSGLPQHDPIPLSSVFRPQTPENLLDLLRKIFSWDPQSRVSGVDVCCHVFFDQLRRPETKLPNGKPLPPLFDLSAYEQTIAPSQNSVLMPEWTRS